MTRTPECRCLACGKKFNSTTGFTGKKEPMPGDLTICLRCGAVMTFSDDLTLRGMTDEEMDNFLADTETMNILARAVGIIKLIPKMN